MSLDLLSYFEPDIDASLLCTLSTILRFISGFQKVYLTLLSRKVNKAYKTVLFNQWIAIFWWFADKHLKGKKFARSEKPLNYGLMISTSLGDHMTRLMSKNHLVLLLLVYCLA